MTVSIGDILQVVAVLAWADGAIFQNVFHTEVTDGPEPLDNQDVVDDMQDWVESIYDTITASCSPNASGSEVRVYKWDTVGQDWDEIGTNLFDFVGVAVVDELPRGVAGLINAKTTDPDVNGKKYIGGMTEGSVTDGLLTVGEVARLVAYATEWLQVEVGVASGGDFDAGIWSPTQELLFDLSGTMVIPAIPAYQRRRKRGIGI